MFQELKLSSSEIKNFILSLLIITIVFSYNDRNPVFAWNSWLQNLLITLCITALILLIYILTIKYFSFRQGNFSSFQFIEKSPKEYIRSIIALALTLISNGLLYFTPIYSIKTEKIRKLGQRYNQEKEYEVALSLFFGMFSTLILLLFFNYLDLELGVLVSIWFLAWNLIPIASSTGTDLFFFSRPLYTFSIIFFPLTIILALKLPNLVSLILSLILASIIFVYYMFKIESGIK